MLARRRPAKGLPFNLFDDADPSRVLHRGPGMGGFIMRTSSSQFRPHTPNAEPDVVFTDDGGSGLFAACKSRFASPDYEVECDARHTVWVKRVDGTRSFGLAPWLVRQHSVNEVLERTETKLRLPVGKH